MALRKSTLSWLIFVVFVSFLSPVNCESGEEEGEASSKEDEKPRYQAPKVVGNFFIRSTFENQVNDWIQSEAKKDGVEAGIAKYDGKWSFEVPASSAVTGDNALILKSKARHHAISRRLSKAFEFSKNTAFVMQYDVKFQEPLECGGAYVKLLSETEPAGSFKSSSFHDKTPYTIMFGPDKCGNENKFHFIFRYKNHLMKDFEEKHMKKMDKDFASIMTDKRTHLLTLLISTDNSFEVYIDKTRYKSGSLLKDFNPPVVGEADIDDPSDKKPKHWDDREKIPDPEAVKPDDWDENEPEKVADETAVKPEGWLDHETPTIADPSAVQPEDWDVEMDGEWEAPQIDNPACSGAPGCGKWQRPEIKNPKYRGKWKAPTIANPDYQGIWKAKKIPNPYFFDDENPLTGLANVAAVGFELWSMTSEIAFDNVIITDSLETAFKFADETWMIKKRAESIGSESVYDVVANAIHEKPWLLAVLLVAVILPIVLIITCCCSSSTDDLKKRKKEDVPQADVDDDDDEGPPPLEEQETAEQETQVTADDTSGDEGDDDYETEPKEATQPSASPSRKRNIRKE